MLNENFQYLIKKFGAPNPAQVMKANQEAKLRSQLPDSLVDFLKIYGFGQWLEGRFQFCRPDDYAAILEIVFKNDLDFDPKDCHIYGYSAFNKLFVWHRKYNNIFIDVVYQNVTSTITSDDEKKNVEIKLGPNVVVAIELSGIGGPSYGGFDKDSKPLFPRALKTLGRLEFGECYGFVPALGLGGEAKLENLQRVRALEHFSILASLGRFHLVDYATGQQKFVRYIGK